MKIALRLTMLVALGCAAAACTSPERQRTRGGGAGGDIGNRPAAVKMHEGSQPFWGTPVRIGDAAHPPLEPASQAWQLSRP